MLTRLKVANYRSIADIDLDFRKANIIVGPNGSGKSNLIDCLNFLRDCTIQDLDYATTRRHGVDSIRRWSKTRPYNVIMEVYFDGPSGKGQYKVTLSSGAGTFRVSDESGHWTMKDARDADRQSYASFNRNSAGEISFSGDMRDDRGRTLSPISSTDMFLTLIGGPLFSPSIVPFRGLSREISALSTYSIYPNTIRLPQSVSRDDALANDGSNLSSVLKKLNTNQRHRKERLLEALRVVIPSLSDVVIKSAGGFYVPVFRIRESSGELHEFNMSQLSDGTLRMLGLLTAFYQPQAPRRIAIEEPEQMIHPGLLPLLRDASDDYASMRPDNQYFITTHSPHLLDQFDPQDMIWMSIEHGISIARRMGAKKIELIRDDLFSPGEMLVSEGLGV